MARYVKMLPMVADRKVTFARIKQYLSSKKFQLVTLDGEQVFQKGKGVWVAPGFLKVTYHETVVRVEAWINALGAEQDLEGFVAVAAKKPLKEHVAQVEAILTQADPNYTPEPPQVRYCPACGEKIESGSFCGKCGRPTTIQDIKPASERPFPEGTTLKEYYKLYAGETFYKHLKIIAICAYVLCGILGLTVMLNVIALVDLAIYLGLTLGMHLGKSRGCAIGILAYGGLGFVATLFLMGRIAGWGWLAVGIWAVILFNNGKKRYEELAAKL